MKQLFLASGCLALLSFGLAARAAQAPAAAPSAPPRATAPRPPAPRAASAAPRAVAPVSTMVAAEQTRLVTTYCATCHSERGKAGGLSLANWDAMKAQQQPEIVEKMIRKMRAGMMPPPGAKKPEAAPSPRSPRLSKRAWTSSRPAIPIPAGGRSSA